MGIEAARQALINEATDTLKEQGLNGYSAYHAGFDIMMLTGM